jgi:Ca2+-binding RTX toxin-like protein
MIRLSPFGSKHRMTSTALAALLAGVLLVATSMASPATAAPQRDNTGPTIKLSKPTRGVTYALKQQAIASYSSRDERGGSGLKNCLGTVPNGSPIETASSGLKSFMVTATDKAGDKAKVTHTYTVSECTILGTAGNDALEGTARQDVICGLGVDATIMGLGDADILEGGDGKDKLSGGAGDDTIDGGLNGDTASFQDSPAGITASSAHRLRRVEPTCGLWGMDKLGAAGGPDQLWGGAGADGLWGGRGDDRMKADSRADRLFGEDGADTLHSQDGVSGNDSLNDGADTDTKATDVTEASILNFP